MYYNRNLQIYNWADKRHNTFDNIFNDHNDKNEDFINERKESYKEYNLIF